MIGALSEARGNGQALLVTVVLHSAVIAFLVLGWSQQQALPEPAPSMLKTRLVMLPAEPLAATPAPVAPEAPQPVAQAEPQVVKPAPVQPPIQARKLEQAALARKRVEEKKQAQLEQQHIARQRVEQAETQRLQALADAAAQQARVAAENARLARQSAAAGAADVRQYLPISKQAPDYPQRALDKGIQGDCTVEYSVTPQGTVDNPKVVGN